MRVRGTGGYAGCNLNSCEIVNHWSSTTTDQEGLLCNFIHDQCLPSYNYSVLLYLEMKTVQTRGELCFNVPLVRNCQYSLYDSTTAHKIDIFHDLF